MSQWSERFLTLFILIGAGLITGCGQSSPTDDEARRAVMDRLKLLSNKAEVEEGSFRKVNGVRAPDGSIYEYDFEIKLHCLSDTFLLGGLCQQGQSLTVKNKLKFRKTENGWEYQKSGSFF